MAVQALAPVDASALCDPAGKLPEAVQDAYPEMAVVRFKPEGVSGGMLIERTKQVVDRYGLAVVVANTA